VLRAHQNTSHRAIGLTEEAIHICFSILLWCVFKHLHCLILLSVFLCHLQVVTLLLAALAHVGLTEEAIHASFFSFSLSSFDVCVKTLAGSHAPVFFLFSLSSGRDFCSWQH